MNLEHFKLEEFDCPCCKENLMDFAFLEKLDFAREDASVPFRISSGYRCEIHNGFVGGSITSSHREGYAADIECSNSVDRFAIIRALLKAGFNRIGVSAGFIHVDDDPKKSPHVIWTY